MQGFFLTIVPTTIKSHSTFGNSHKRPLTQALNISLLFIKLEQPPDVIATLETKITVFTRLQDGNFFLRFQAQIGGPVL